MLSGRTSVWQAARPMQEPIVVRQGGMWVALLATSQFLAPPLLVVGSLYASGLIHGLPFESQYLSLALIAGALSLVIQKLPAELAAQPGTRDPGVMLSVLASWAALVVMLLLIGYVTKTSGLFSRRVMLTWFVLTPVLLLAATAVLRWGLSHFMAIQGTRRAVVAGYNDASRQLSWRLRERSRLGIQVVGFFDDRSSERLAMHGDEQLLGGLTELAGYAKTHGIQVIFIALPIRHVQRVLALLDDLKDTTVSIYYVPDIFLSDLIQSRSGEVAGIPVISMCETPFFGYRGVIKRVADVLLTSIVLIPLLPVLGVVALLVKLSSPGPAIFRQRRYGLDGQEITVYKFRTMTVTEDGDKVVQATVGDRRITPIGAVLRRYSIDELPQLINVLQGRMSLVGPRPHAVAHNEQYRKLIKGYMVRHKVLPGITGLAQVNGCRGETSKIEEMQARVEYDLQYLRQWSLALDIRILIKTVLMLWGDKKAY